MAKTDKLLCEKGPSLDKADKLSVQTFWILDWLQRDAKMKGRGFTWIVENPETGRLKERPFMVARNYNYKDVTYCMYGTDYRKPTRLWSNSLLLHEFDAKFCGRDGHKCRKAEQHQPLPSGSVNRSAIPADLPIALFKVLFQAGWEQGGCGRQLAKEVRKIVATGRGGMIEFEGKKLQVTCIMNE